MLIATCPWPSLAWVQHQGYNARGTTGVHSGVNQNVTTYSGVNEQDLLKKVFTPQFFSLEIFSTLQIFSLQKFSTSNFFT